MQTDSHISVVSPDRYYGYSRHTEMTFCNYESPCQTTRNPMLAAEMQGPYIGLCVCVFERWFLRRQVQWSVDCVPEHLVLLVAKLHGPIRGLGCVQYDFSTAHVDAALSVLTGSSPLHTASMSVFILHRHHNSRLIRQKWKHTISSSKPRDTCSSVLFFIGPRSKGWPHYGRTFSILSLSSTGVGPGPADLAVAEPITWQTRIFMFTLYQQHENNTISPRSLTPLNHWLCHIIPTKWRSCRVIDSVILSLHPMNTDNQGCSTGYVYWYLICT